MSRWVRRGHQGCPHPSNTISTQEQQQQQQQQQQQ